MAISKRDPNKIYLSAIRDGDQFKIIDQDGREVWGLKSISVDAREDDLTAFTATCLDASVTGREESFHTAHVNRNA